MGVFEAVLDAISSGKSTNIAPGFETDPVVGKMKPDGMITKTIKMDEVVEEGFKTLIDDKENHVKILVDVGAGI